MIPAKPFAHFRPSWRSLRPVRALPTSCLTLGQSQYRVQGQQGQRLSEDWASATFQSGEKCQVIRNEEDTYVGIPDHPLPRCGQVLGDQLLHG